MLYDQNNDKFTFYNQAQFKEHYSPASTFKICNSLIGIETGIIMDENFIIVWDSVMRPNTKWNQDRNPPIISTVCKYTKSNLFS